MGIGTMKRAPQKQWDKVKKEYNGNKFFILQDVKPEDRNRVPKEFTFDVQGIGKLSVRLNHRYQVRYCSFCGNWHEAWCEVKQRADAIAKEKAALVEEKEFTLKVCGDSTVRYLNENAVQGAVEAMSGATMGNLLNSIDVDDQESEHVVFVAGSNEKKADLSPEEYIYALKVIRERVNSLQTDKGLHVAIVPPPIPAGLSSPETMVKEEFSRTLCGGEYWG